MERCDDERLFPLKLFALRPKATEFDGGGVRSSVGQNEAGALSTGQLLQYERVSYSTVHTARLGSVAFFLTASSVFSYYEQSVFHLYPLSV